jgi:hypothetical protein
MSRTPKSVSPERLAANRANAAHSSGPKTSEGKARSAKNSLKHGFTAAHFAVVRLEDLDEIDQLKADLIAVYQPVNSQELLALERMALAQQSMFRAARLESGLFTTCINETLDANERPFTPMSKQLAGEGSAEVTRSQNRNYCLADGFVRLARQSNGWSVFLRYQAQAERQYRRALEEFDRLKALRSVLPNEPNPQLQPEPESATYPAPTTNPIPAANPPAPTHNPATPHSSQAHRDTPKSAKIQSKKATQPYFVAAPVYPSGRTHVTYEPLLSKQRLTGASGPL